MTGPVYNVIEINIPLSMCPFKEVIFSLQWPHKTGLTVDEEIVTVTHGPLPPNILRPCMLFMAKLRLNIANKNWKLMQKKT